jgi:hypothetical protein
MYEYKVNGCGGVERIELAEGWYQCWATVNIRDFMIILSV